MPANAEHETVNTSNEVIRELVVSIPVRFDTQENWRIPSVEEDPLSAAIQALELESLTLQGFLIVIINAITGQIFNLPGESSCLTQRITELDPATNHLHGEINLEHPICSELEGVIICDIAIQDAGEIIGYVRGGFLTEDNRSHYSDTPMSKSTSVGIDAFLKQIADGIEGYLQFHRMRQELLQQEAVIRKKSLDLQSAKTSLQVEKQKATNLKINHHFLFNVLNHFASLSLSGDRKDLYEGIIDLSKMLRYSSRAEFQMVTFSEELEYVDKYIKLQRRRYGDSMKVELEIEAECNHQQVPFNFLQPIVEHAFSHGFMEFDGEKLIQIFAKKQEQRFLVQVRNNGQGLGMVTAKRVNKELGDRNGHALNLLYEKFTMAYGPNFGFRIYQFDGMTTVDIELPWRKQ